MTLETPKNPTECLATEVRLLVIGIGVNRNRSARDSRRVTACWSLCACNIGGSRYCQTLEFVNPVYSRIQLLQVRKTTSTQRQSREPQQPTQVTSLTMNDEPRAVQRQITGCLYHLSYTFSWKVNWNTRQTH